MSGNGHTLGDQLKDTADWIAGSGDYDQSHLGAKPSLGQEIKNSTVGAADPTTESKKTDSEPSLVKTAEEKIGHKKAKAEKKTEEARESANEKINDNADYVKGEGKYRNEPTVGEQISQKLEDAKESIRETFQSHKENVREGESKYQRSI